MWPLHMESCRLIKATCAGCSTDPGNLPSVDELTQAMGPCGPARARPSRGARPSTARRAGRHGSFIAAHMSRPLRGPFDGRPLRSQLRFRRRQSPFRHTAASGRFPLWVPCAARCVHRGMGVVPMWVPGGVRRQLSARWGLTRWASQRPTRWHGHTLASLDPRFSGVVA